jgi:hypothetical protein
VRRAGVSTQAPADATGGGEDHLRADQEAAALGTLQRILGGDHDRGGIPVCKVWPARLEVHAAVDGPFRELKQGIALARRRLPASVQHRDRGRWQGRAPLPTC